MLADTTAAALLANTAMSSMLADTVAAAFHAEVAQKAMLADAVATAFLTSVTPAPMKAENRAIRTSPCLGWCLCLYSSYPKIQLAASRASSFLRESLHPATWVRVV
jgi:hypothetical protein